MEFDEEMKEGEDDDVAFSDTFLQMSIHHYDNNQAMEGHGAGEMNMEQDDMIHLHMISPTSLE